jgi:hypothetical protein
VRDEAIAKLKAAVESSKNRIQDLEAELFDAQQQVRRTQETAGSDRQKTGDVLARTRKALEVAQRLLS